MDMSDDPILESETMWWPMKPPGKKDDGGFTIPSTQAEQATQTAGQAPQLSEHAKRTRRLRASMLTREWGGPKLGQPGLLGL